MLTGSVPAVWWDTWDWSETFGTPNVSAGWQWNLWTKHSRPRWSRSRRHERVLRRNGGADEARLILDSANSSVRLAMVVFHQEKATFSKFWQSTTVIAFFFPINSLCAKCFEKCVSFSLLTFFTCLACLLHFFSFIAWTKFSSTTVHSTRSLLIGQKTDHVTLFATFFHSVFTEKSFHNTWLFSDIRLYGYMWKDTS